MFTAVGEAFTPPRAQRLIFDYVLFGLMHVLKSKMESWQTLKYGDVVDIL